MANQMKNNTIVLGCIFTLSILVIVPSIPAIEQNHITQLLNNDYNELKGVNGLREFIQRVTQNDKLDNDIPFGLQLLIYFLSLTALIIVLGLFFIVSQITGFGT